MIVDDFDLKRIAVAPSETNSPLLIDADRMLPPAIARQCFEAVSRRHTQILQTHNGVEHQKLSPRLTFDRLHSTNGLIAKQSLCIAIGKTLDHVQG